jgi:hypothetical protein
LEPASKSYRSCSVQRFWPGRWRCQRDRRTAADGEVRITILMHAGERALPVNRQAAWNARTAVGDEAAWTGPEFKNGAAAIQLADRPEWNGSGCPTVRAGRTAASIGSCSPSLRPHQRQPPHTKHARCNHRKGRVSNALTGTRIIIRRFVCARSSETPLVPNTKQGQQGFTIVPCCFAVQLGRDVDLRPALLPRSFISKKSIFHSACSCPTLFILSSTSERASRTIGRRNRP